MIFRISIPPFEKGGLGGIYLQQSKANPPHSPFTEGGGNYCRRSLLIRLFDGVTITQ